ncbi:hypothetical protein V5O48_013224 [Marasmius crinis-equi]|uniref:Uncharacterized protein n=1 Tax=Marasmius crinis-equi TaxID=585013 RepID=A0ABR3F0T9_9AGAR
MGSLLECMTIHDSNDPNQSPFSLLEALAFKVHGWPFTRDHRKLVNFFQVTPLPALKDLSITYLDVDRSLTFTREFTLPYSQLRNLKFRAHDTIELPHILSSCHSLVTLEMELISRDSPTTPTWYNSLMQTPLPNLTDLTMHIYLTEGSYTINDHLLAHLYCPSLLSLTLRGASNSSFVTSEPFLRRSTIHAKLFEHGVVSFLSNSGCTLTHLTIDTISITSRSLFQLLQTPLCSSLLYLCAKEVEPARDTLIGFENESLNFSEDLFRGLFDSSLVSSLRLLPSLRNLRIKMATGVNDEIFASLESIPCFRHVSLESVVFEIPDNLTGSLRRDLYKDIAVAMKVVGYPSGKVFVGAG